MLTFEEIEDCFPEVGGTTDDGSAIVSAQWLHDFARAVELKSREACAKLCDSRRRTVSNGNGLCMLSHDPASVEAGCCADAIRAGSNVAVSSTAPASDAERSA